MARQAARLARSNAEASIDRLRAEARRTETEIEHYERVLAASHRFARGVMALEANLREIRDGMALSALPRFVDAVERDLQAVAGALRDTAPLRPHLPDLPHEQGILAEEAAARMETDPSSYWLAELIGETDRIAESVTSMVALLQAPGPEKQLHTASHHPAL